MNILDRLGQLLGVRTDEVECVLRTDERRAKETVNRRRFIGVAAALAAAPFVPNLLVEPAPERAVAVSLADSRISMWMIPGSSSWIRITSFGAGGGGGSGLKQTPVHFDEMPSTLPKGANLNIDWQTLEARIVIETG